jgi:hypothetical protein
MNDQMQERLKKGEAIHALGRRGFILRYGILYWGIPLGVFMVLFNAWQRGFSPAYIVIAAIVWPIAGTVYGAIMWRKSEERYRQFIATGGKDA